MNPIQKFLKRLFVKKRVVEDDPKLGGLAASDAILCDLVNEKKVPGLAITVIKDGKTILQKGYGYADLEKEISIDPSKTIFRIASVSKPIAATALAHMVANEQIDLDASFYDYVPYFPKKKRDFTIRQLASHTAGIRGYKGMEYGLNKPYTIKESIEIFKDDALLFEPGTNYLYNSYDWVLISLAMQEVSGIPFEVYVKEKVLGPLGMANTFAPNVTLSARPNDTVGQAVEGLRNSKEASTALSLIDNLATFYSKNRLGFRKAIPVNNFYKLAGGGYLSTCEDISKLGQAYLDGEILNEEIRTKFLTSETVNGKPTYYGLGWQVSEDKVGRHYYGHIGNGVGGYSNFLVYPEEQMVFSIVINCTDPKVQDDLDKVAEVLLKA